MEGFMSSAAGLDFGEQPPPPPPERVSNLPGPGEKGYRTVPCHYFAQGLCTKGDNCTFLHEGVSPGEKTVPCKFHHQGLCRKGDDCPYRHDGVVQLDPAVRRAVHKTVPCTHFARGFCQRGEQCSFYHEGVDPPPGTLQAPVANFPPSAPQYGGGVSSFASMSGGGLSSLASMSGGATGMSALSTIHSMLGVGVGGAPDQKDAAKQLMRSIMVEALQELTGLGSPQVQQTLQPQPSIGSNAANGCGGFAAGGKGLSGKGGGKNSDGKYPCKFYREGRCKNGENCGFSHEGAGGTSSTPGYRLERTRITAEPFPGVVVEWKGKYGWIQPTAQIDHPKAQFRGGKLFVSKDDVTGGVELGVNLPVKFHIFEDSSGLGADEVEADLQAFGNAGEPEPEVGSVFL